jgi:hypothetical protein
MNQDQDLSPAEVRCWLEFASWTTLALAPLLYWLNGPAVSTDQFVVRIGLVILAACGAIGLRLYAWRQRRRDTLRTPKANEVQAGQDGCYN